MMMNSAPVKKGWTANGSFPGTNARREPTRASAVSTITAMSAFISGEVSFRCRHYALPDRCKGEERKRRQGEGASILARCSKIRRVSRSWGCGIGS